MKLEKRWMRQVVSIGLVVSALSVGSLGHYALTRYWGPAIGGAGSHGRVYNSGALLLSSLSDTQLVQKILDAVQPEANVQAIYDSIPIYQLNGLTYEEFSTYTTLLASISSDQLDTFSPVTTSEREKIQERMSRHAYAFRDIAFNSNFFWLERSASTGTSLRVPFPVQWSIQNEPYLSRTWINGCVDIHAYGRYYLGVLKSNNAEQLSWLLPDLAKEPAVRLNKARALLSFYSQYHVDFDRDVKVTNLRMDEVTFRIELSSLPSEAHEGAYLKLNRDMSIAAQGDKNYRVLDFVPQELTAADFTVRHYGEAVFAAGDYLKSSDIYAKWGRPQREISQELPAWINYDGNAQLIDVIYPGMTLQVIGIHYAGGDKPGWEGFVRSAVLYSPAEQTEAGVHPGMSYTDLTERYPFIDVLDCTLRDQTRELYIGLNDQLAVYDVRVTDRRFDRNPG